VQYIADNVDHNIQTIDGKGTFHGMGIIVSLKQMLPYFTAAGQNLYAKSAYLYLVNMQKLPNTNPELYDKFIQGYHVIRQSDRYWAVLPTDLVIEQILMRSLKSVGGLTRGRGMTGVQRAGFSRDQQLQILLKLCNRSVVRHSLQVSSKEKHVRQ